MEESQDLAKFKMKCKALKENQMQEQEEPENDQEYQPQKQEKKKNIEPKPYDENLGKFYCGCGSYYTCTSALYFHIRKKHNDVAPEGTRGGPRFRGKQSNVKVEQNGLSKLSEVKIQEGQNIPKTGNPTYRIYKGMLPDSQDQNPTSKNQSEQEQAPKKVTIVKPPPVINENHLLYDNQVGRNFNESSFAPKQCKLCFKDYSCNSALNLHLKRKHRGIRLQDGRMIVEAVPCKDGDFKCQTCDLAYDSKGFLDLHIENKHSKDPLKAVFIKPIQATIHQQVQKCGCGLVYHSRSALHLHVKKKHGGVYPQGTLNPPRPRRRQNNQSYMPEVKQQQQSKKPDIYYDSDSEQKTKPSELSKSNFNTESLFHQQRIHKCGCGRTYSCPSALGLHLKRHHFGVVPQGTIGAPRTYLENQQEYLQTRNYPSKSKEVESIFKCGECDQNLARSSRYVCKTCNHHYICANCFWGKDDLDPQHQWVLDQPRRK